MVMAKLLEAKDITKRFGGLIALNDVSISIDHGERVGIVGPNGSGKTTFFNIINGVYKPDGGRVYFEGRDITNLPPYRRARLGIARAFQIPRPYPNISVRENVASGALFGSIGDKISVDEALEMADDILNLVGLYNKRFEEARLLNVPEKKMLELARALAMKPKLLLLDELVAGMPPKNIDNLINIVKDVSEAENIAVVALVEHVMRAVVKFAERVVILHQGRKILEGPTEEVLRSKIVGEIYLGKYADVLGGG